MPIAMRCLCGRKLWAMDKQAGRRGRCPHCGFAFIVPAQPDIVPAQPDKGSDGRPGRDKTVSPHAAHQTASPASNPSPAPSAGPAPATPAEPHTLAIIESRFLALLRRVGVFVAAACAGIAIGVSVFWLLWEYSRSGDVAGPVESTPADPPAGQPPDSAADKAPTEAPPPDSAADKTPTETPPPDSAADTTPTEAPPPERKPTAITICAETTYLVEPLTRDGQVDYLEAVNRLAARGVTPENNAAILLMQAIGPQGIPQGARDEFFRLLGIEPLPEEGDYFVPMARFAEANNVNPDKWEAAFERPWSADEFPLLAAWLRANDGPLRLVEEGTRRDRLFVPVVPPTGRRTLFFPRFENREFRMLTHALSIRARLRIQRGDIDRTWRDVQTNRRMARLLTQSPFVTHRLVGLGTEGTALRDATIMALEGRLEGERPQRLIDSLRASGPASVTGKGIAGAFRYAELEAITRLAAPDARSKAAGNMEFRGGAAWLVSYAKNGNGDWDTVLRTFNTQTAQIVAACRLPTHRQRRQTLAQLQRIAREHVGKDHLDDMGRMINVKEVIGRLNRETSLDAQARLMRALFVLDYAGLFAVLADADARTATAYRMTQLTIALAGFHEENGSYPEKLAELAPKYIAAIPNDPCVDRAFGYKRKSDGYFLFSPGPDMTTEFDEKNYDRSLASDLVVECPPVYDHPYR